MLQKNPHNMFDHMDINVLTIFEYSNEEALRQFGLCTITDGAMVINYDGRVVASGATVNDVAKGSQEGGKKTAAASSAAQGDGEDEATLCISCKVSEDTCQTELTLGEVVKEMQAFNGALGLKKGGKEGYKLPIRNPKVPVVTDVELMRLATDGHVAGVKAFVAEAAKMGRSVDEPRNDYVRVATLGSGVGAFVLIAHRSLASPF